MFVAHSRICEFASSQTFIWYPSDLKRKLAASHWRIILKLVPVLGTVVLVGVIVQIILGLQITGAGVDSYIGPHMLIGLLGLVLVIILAIAAFRVKTATIYSKLILTILTLMVLLQVGLGFQLLQGDETIIVSHEANGFLILTLTLVMGAVTMLSARRHT
jgi:hypothetical protein